MQAQQVSLSSSSSLLLSLLHAPTRTCVYQFDGSAWVNMNDACGLPSFGSYTISEYIEDVLRYEQKRLTAVRGTEYRFADGSLLRLEQREEPMDETEFLELLAL